MRELDLRAKIIESGPDRLPREEREVTDIMGGLQPLGSQALLVEHGSIVGDMRVGELHQLPQPDELILRDQLGTQPLGALELPEPAEGGLALEALVQWKDDVPDQGVVHAGLFSAAFSSSRACSTLSAQSKRLA